MIETKIRMRFADIDVLGHVNNVNQQHYFDLGKCDFYKQVLGLTPFWGSAGLIIVASQTHYIVQTRRDEPIVVYTRVARIGNKSFTLEHKLVNSETQEVKTECTAVMVAYNFDEQHSFEMPEEWKEYGLWRWKNAPKSIREEVHRISGKEVSELTKQTKAPERGPLTIKVQEGYSPCTIGYSIEAALSRPIDIAKVKPFCHAIGWVVTEDPEGEFVSADYTTIYREGAIICKANVENDARKHMDHAFQVVVRAEQCVGCGLCAARCDPGALYMEDGHVKIHEDDCIYCRDCFGPCPSVNFARDNDGFDQ